VVLVERGIRPRWESTGSVPRVGLEPTMAPRTSDVDEPSPCCRPYPYWSGAQDSPIMRGQ
jgi:hypothetical protein